MTNLSAAPLGMAPGYDAGSRIALLIAESDAAGRDSRLALDEAGVVLRARMAWADAANELSNHDGLDLLLIEAGDAPDTLIDVVLARVDTLARERGLPVIAAMRPDQIDLVAAQLQAPGAQLLCEPSAAERAGAVSFAKWRPRAQLRVAEATREAESARLRRLSEEVARIAETLARLTREEDLESRNSVRAAGMDYRGPDDEGPQITPREIRATIRARRLRAQFFDSELFADPAWDMLLDLFAAHLERQRVSVSSLCIAAAVPPTTALRWIANLHDAGLFERQADPTDRRRAYIALSERGVAAMKAYVAAARRMGLGIV